jgi:hypothetical protein
VNYPISVIRNITNLQQSLSFTPGMHISYEHGHIMEKAIKTCASYGFIHIDTNDELTSRILQARIHCRKPNAKRIGQQQYKKKKQHGCSA